MFETKEKIVKLAFSKNDDYKILTVIGEKGKTTYLIRYWYDDIYMIKRLKEKYILTKDQIKFITDNYALSSQVLRNKKKWEEFIEWYYSDAV